MFLVQVFTNLIPESFYSSIAMMGGGGGGACYKECQGCMHAQNVCGKVSEASQSLSLLSIHFLFPSFRYLSLPFLTHTKRIFLFWLFSFLLVFLSFFSLALFPFLVILSFYIYPFSFFSFFTLLYSFSFSRVFVINF